MKNWEFIQQNFGFCFFPFIFDYSISIAYRTDLSIGTSIAFFHHRVVADVDRFAPVDIKKTCINQFIRYLNITVKQKTHYGCFFFFFCEKRFIE